MQFKSTQQVPQEKQMSIKSMIHSLILQTFIQHLRSVRSPTRNKSHHVKENGLPRCSQSSLGSFKSMHSRQVGIISQGHCITKYKFSSNTCKLLKVSQMILMRQFPVLFQVMRGFPSMQCCAGTNRDLF